MIDEKESNVRIIENIQADFESALAENDFDEAEKIIKFAKDSGFVNETKLMEVMLENAEYEFAENEALAYHEKTGRYPKSYYDEVYG